MQPSDLKLGDIIISGVDNDSLPWHVSMYTGDIDDKPHITHSIIHDTHGGLQTTRLKNYGEMFVFRPKNAALGSQAADILLSWAKYQIPYDLKRNAWMRHTHSKLRESGGRTEKGKIDFLLDYLKLQAKAKFYERIKFAARRDTCPVKMLEGITSRGFTCVQAVILAYQIAEIAHLVKPLNEVEHDLRSNIESKDQVANVWISDKHCPKTILESKDTPKSYIRYAVKLNLKDEFPKFEFNDKNIKANNRNANYLSSLVAWRYDLEPSIEKFIDAFDSCLKLPSKICFTPALQEYLARDLEHWIDLGALDTKPLPLIFNDAEKTVFKKHLVEHSRRVAEEQEKIKSFHLALSVPCI